MMPLIIVNNTVGSGTFEGNAVQGHQCNQCSRSADYDLDT
jgi:hypothetical protein